MFDESFTAQPPENRSKITVDESFYAAVPPFETFCNADKESKIKRFFEVKNFKPSINKSNIDKVLF